MARYGRNALKLVALTRIGRLLQIAFGFYYFTRSFTLALLDNGYFQTTWLISYHQYHLKYLES